MTNIQNRIHSIHSISEEMEISQHKPIMIVGDFNFIEHADDTVYTQNFYNTKDIAAFKKLKEEAKLFDDFRLKYRKKELYTRTSAGGRRIDRIYVNSQIAINIYELKHVPITFSDHNLAPMVYLGRKQDTMCGYPHRQINNELLTPENKVKLARLWQKGRKRKLYCSSNEW